MMVVVLVLLPLVAGSVPGVRAVVVGRAPGRRPAVFVGHPGGHSSPASAHFRSTGRPRMLPMMTAIPSDMTPAPISG